MLDPSPVSDPVIVYTDFWHHARDAHPDCWQDQLRCMHKLAKLFLEGAASQAVLAPWLGPAERALLDTLAGVDPELMILKIAAAFPHDRDPLRRLDPEAPIETRTASQSVGGSRHG
jgi:hypothetical protein